MLGSYSKEPFPALLHPPPFSQMPKRPQIVIDDPWLESHEEAIAGRLQCFEDESAHIRAQHVNLHSYANSHLQLGLHFDVGASLWVVREWAPAARSVSLIGDFNEWDGSTHPLKLSAGGIWELELPAHTLKHEQGIKLRVIGADGRELDRIPACIRRSVQNLDSKDYSGQVWQPAKDYSWQHDFDPSEIGIPLIYECHVGMAGEEPRLHSYREFTDKILPRIATAGYNTIQLMAIQEHPYYGSFGYHVSSFFASSSRFGTPEDLKQLIDTAHGLGIAVLLDIVHSHAVKNMAEGINDFDGSGHQYFHAGDRGDHPQWDSKCFDYGKSEVRRFLLSNVRYWLEEFRFDGFRFDGVTSMLYHSRGAKSFGSYDDYFGADADPDAILYLQLATSLARETKPGVILVAEDMSGMPGLCRPVKEGGIGFTHRLAMGIPDYWIKVLKHQKDEEWNLDELWSTLSDRRQNEATIAYAESHDQALVGDKTLAMWLMNEAMYDHMAKYDPDSRVERGIALHKMIRLITLVCGGEGWLNFMGNEFGHPEWLDFPREGNNWSSHYCRRQWSLMDNPDLKYHWLSDFDRELIEFVKQSNLLASPPAQCVKIDHDNRIIIIERANRIFVFNFSQDRSIPDYSFTIHGHGDHKLVLDSDATTFGGHGRLQACSIHSVDAEEHEMKIYTTSRSAQVYTP